MGKKVMIVTVVFLLMGILFVTAETINLRKGELVEIVSPLESNGAIPVNIQDQHSRALDLFFGQIGDLTTLSVLADSNNMTLTLTDTTGFVDGVTVGIFSIADPEVFYLGTQLGSPVGNVITIDTPIDGTFPINSSVASVDTNMAVDGSSTTQVFQIGPVGPGSTQELDITRIMGHILDGNSMDDGKFGGISALTNGIVLRHNNHVLQNIWNAKTNGELALLTYDTSYSDKAPSGSYGFNFRNTFAGPSKHGVTLRLEPGDTLEILIQDDLTGLDSFKMMAQGHVVTD